MMTPNDIISELKNIKEALNMLEIRGEQNANNLLFACQKCDKLIRSLGEIIESTKTRLEQKNDDAEAGE